LKLFGIFCSALDEFVVFPQFCPKIADSFPCSANLSFVENKNINKPLKARKNGENGENGENGRFRNICRENKFSNKKW
jgi:hypothetical protein